MSNKPERITEKNVLTVNVTDIAGDYRFSELEFKSARGKIPQIQKWITEAYELGAEKHLLENDLNTLVELKQRLAEHLEELLTFEIRTTNDTALRVHDGLENQTNELFRRAYEALAMRILPFLRQETVQSIDQQELDEERKAAAKARIEYEGLSKQIEKELKEIKERRSEVEKGHGELVAVSLGADFGNQSESYTTEAQKWLEWRKMWLRILFAVVASNIALFIIATLLHTRIPFFIAPEEIFTLQYAIAKLALLLLLSYLIGFCSRNYNINAGLAATNRHRKNIAEVLRSTLSSPLSDESKGEVVRIAATEMFKHLSVGYIRKEHQSDTGPILEVIRKVDPTNPKNN